MSKHPFMTDEQYARFTELLNKFNSRKRMSIEEHIELEDLLDLDLKGYETPEYKAFAAKMDAQLRAMMGYPEEVREE